MSMKLIGDILHIFFPEVVETDKNLERLMLRNTFIAEKWVEVKDEIKYSIQDELLLLPYSSDGILDENLLLNEVFNIADNILRASLFKSLLDDHVDSASLPLSYTFLEDEETIQSQTDASSDNEIGALESLKPIERELRDFKLDSEGLLKGLSDYRFRLHNQGTLIKRSPIIKQVGFFDPAIYSINKVKPSTFGHNRLANL